MKVFVAALDWGLGHTTRMMPIIHQLYKQNHQLVIGCSLVQKRILQEQFPEALYKSIVSCSPVFSRKPSQIVSLLRFIPRFLFSVYKEKKQLQKLHQHYHFDVILSDNRYGLHLPGCRNIIITHQLQIVLPHKVRIFKNLINKVLHSWINKFDQCLVPDIEGDIRLCGILSARYFRCDVNVKYIGILSRFQFITEKKSQVPELLIIISGPENQRSVFEQMVEKQLPEVSGSHSYLIVRGKPGNAKVDRTGFVNHINSEELKYILKHTKYIVCRSGYSTIMDLIYLKKTALLVPTPGQSEQEYLARHVSNHQWFITEDQTKLNLQKAIDKLDNFTPHSFELAQESIENFSI
jgi:UDP-N-acetylglucosamine:LPS N-acetylglucosamine transferase